MRPPNILYILLPLFTVTGAVKVTTRTSPLSVLRDEDVYIPCDISDLNPGKSIAVQWKMTSENGTEYDVYENIDGKERSYRPGSSMKTMEIRNGNAELHLSRVQFSDEGEYTCRVFNTPDLAEGRVTLQVSVPPLADVTPADPTVEVGTEKTMLCDVHNFYPKDISIRWGQYRKGSSDFKTLDIWTCVKNVLMNSDGTYNVTSLLTVSPKMEDNGNIYSCIIKHRSLQTGLSRNVTLTVKERKDNKRAVIIAIIAVVVATILAVLFPGLLVFRYIIFIKKDPPILSEIIGNDELIDMNRTTLTCQIMDFKPNDIEISVYMRRSGEEEMRTIYTWRSGGHLTLVRISRDDGGGDEDVVDMEEGRQLMNGSAGHEDIPLQLEVTPVISMKNLGKFTCQCSLQITPSYDLDNGAELSVRVNHPALTSPVWVHRTLNVIGVPPKLLSIISPERVIHEEQLTLTCPINGFKPRALTITWLRRERDHPETELVTWNSGSQTIHSDKYSHSVKEDEYEDKSYIYISALIMKPTIEDDGVTYICRIFHTATNHREDKEKILNVIVPPKLLSIMSPERVIHEEQLTLTCPINGFKPRALSITWLRRERNLRETELVTWNSGSNTIHSDKYSHRVQENEHEDKSYSYISALIMKPTIREDDGVTYICRIFHPATRHREEREKILNVIVPPKLLSIMSPERVIHEEQLTLTCPISGFKPRVLSITWLRRERDHPETELVTWNSGIETIHSDKYSHRIQENEHEDKLYSYTSFLIMKPTIGEDDGVTYICRIFHPATRHREEREKILNVIGDSNKAEKSPETGPEKKL